MARLKRWESPRHEGRNDKGRGGSARQRQLMKRQRQLQRKLRQQSLDPPQSPSSGGSSPPFFMPLSMPV